MKIANVTKGGKSYFTRASIMIWMLICTFFWLSHLSSQAGPD